MVFYAQSTSAVVSGRWTEGQQRDKYSSVYYFVLQTWCHRTTVRQIHHCGPPEDNRQIHHCGLPQGPPDMEPEDNRQIHHCGLPQGLQTWSQKTTDRYIAVVCHRVSR